MNNNELLLVTVSFIFRLQEKVTFNGWQIRRSPEESLDQEDIHHQLQLWPVARCPHVRRPRVVPFPVTCPRRRHVARPRPDHVEATRPATLPRPDAVITNQIRPLEDGILRFQDQAEVFSRPPSLSLVILRTMVLVLAFISEKQLHTWTGFHLIYLVNIFFSNFSKALFFKIYSKCPMWKESNMWKGNFKAMQWRTPTTTVVEKYTILYVGCTWLSVSVIFNIFTVIVWLLGFLSWH